MKQWLLGLTIAVIGFAIAVPEAEARRLGGARSIGVQRSVTPPPARPAQQTQQAQQAQGARQGTPAAAPASGLSRWAPMLGGLAIGGMLGAMFGNGMGGLLLSALMIGLLAFAALSVYRMLSQRRDEPARPLQYAGLGSETVAAPPPSQMAGFDAGAVPSASAGGGIPAGFDVAAFLRGAKLNFIRLQVANDQGKVEELREVTTPAMYAELERQVAERAAGTQQTDVVQLNADLLEVSTEADTHWASVRFSGLIRETPDRAPEAFEEVWSLSKPVDGSTGWLLAGIQQIH
ncbi:MAG: Tim44 domain-containing protein [Burkholderiales bacterium]